jgi:hypothetical protein
LHIGWEMGNAIFFHWGDNAYPFSNTNYITRRQIMLRRKTVFVMAALAVFSLLFGLAIPGTRVARADEPLPNPITHQHFNSVQGPLTQDGNGTPGESVYKNSPSPVCSNPTSNDPNVNTDCEGVAPHNETSIAVNPNNASNIVASANDYQLRLSKGGQINETTFSRAHVSFDGGKTWTSYPIKYKGYVATGDPAVAFDASGNVYLATLGFVWSQGYGLGTNPDILVAHSSDGGKTWSAPSRVVAGSGSWGSVGLFNDKEYLTAWGDGNAIVTWTEFNDGIGGSYINSPIYASVTHNAGRSWSTPVEISGSASFCIGALGGNACDQDQGSTPVVAADGSIYVSFLSTRETTNYSDYYLVVKLDPTTGKRVAGPFKVADVVDGITDYPVSIDGRQTYQDSQFRTWSLGNIAADPTNADHLAVVWSDMRNSAIPAPSNPYSATTNSDVVVSQSWDGGQSWSTAQAITLPNDQFMPWSVYDSSGRLNIGFFDRSYDPNNHAYGYSLAKETTGGSLSFSMSQVTTELSDPTQGTRWFSGRTPNPDFPNPTTFLGDYSGIANGPDGVVAYWTDLRETVTFTTRTGTGQDAFFGRAP